MFNILLIAKSIQFFKAGQKHHHHEHILANL